MKKIKDILIRIINFFRRKKKVVKDVEIVEVEEKKVLRYTKY